MAPEPPESRQERLTPLYREQAEKETLHGMAGLLDGYTIQAEEKSKATERGELLKYFAHKLGITIPRVAAKLGKGLNLEDLYYIKSATDSYERDGNPWSKGFHGMLKPRD